MECLLLPVFFSIVFAVLLKFESMSSTANMECSNVIVEYLKLQLLPSWIFKIWQF